MIVAQKELLLGIEPKFEEKQKGFKVTIYKEKFDVGVNELYTFIETYQPVKANVLAEYFNNVTQRTIERWLKQLKDEDKIVFRGSSKTGGYVIK